MKANEKYLQALKTFDEAVSIATWSSKYLQMFPPSSELDLSSELKQTIQKISLKISSGKFNESVFVDCDETPRLVKFITKDEFEKNTEIIIDADLEPIIRKELIKSSKDSLEAKELYRVTEFENIQKGFKEFFKIDFEIVAMQYLLDQNKDRHYNPTNLQFLLKHHQNKKANNSWDRFTIDEQIEYIKKVVELQGTLNDRLCVEINNSVLESLISRLIAIY